MAASLGPPDALKQIKPYVTLATQLEQKNEKVVAYYCRLYAVQQGMNINKSQPDCKKFLFQLMDLLELTKKQNPNDEAIHSETAGQAFVEDYALRIFGKADDDDRQSKFNKNLVKQFYSAGLLFDVLNCFGDLSEDLVAKKQYAKRKAMYLNRCFQTGEAPIPGPIVGDAFNEETDGESGAGAGAGAGGSGGYETNASAPHNSNYGLGGYGSSGASPSSSSTHNNDNRPSSSSKNKSTTASNANDLYYEQGTVSNESSFPPEVMQKAQKLCKYAQSALQYDDVKTAIANLEQCLRVLKTGKE